MSAHPFRALARGAGMVALVSLGVVAAGLLFPAVGHAAAAVAAVPMITGAVFWLIATLFARRADADVARMDAGHYLMRWTLGPAEWNRFVESRVAEAGASRTFLWVLAVCGALVSAAFVPAYGFGVLAAGAAAGALAGAAVDRARPGALRSAWGTARGEVEIVLGEEGVRMNGRYLSWLTQRLNAGSVAVTPGDPCVVHVTARAVSQREIPVPYQIPVPREHAEAAAAALRALALRAA